MGDLLLATGALLGILVVLCLAGLALTVVPFVVATDRAERAGLSPARGGALALVTIGLGLGLAGLVVLSDRGLRAVLVPLWLCWAAPLLLSLRPVARLVGGRRGAHE